MDRYGHRFLSLAISEGATLFDANGKPELSDAGFRRAAQMIVDWHKSGVMSKDLWGSVSGSACRGANAEFANGQVVADRAVRKDNRRNVRLGCGADPMRPGELFAMPGGAALSH